MPRAIAPLWFAFLAAVLLATASLALHAEPVSADDAKAVRAVVEAQLEAFAADDAKKAFSYAAPSIRKMFGTPERFIDDGPGRLPGGLPARGRHVPAAAAGRGPARPGRPAHRCRRCASGSRPTASSARPTGRGGSAAATSGRPPAA